MPEVAIIDAERIQNEVVEPKEKTSVKFGVGMSQDWDPYKAGVQATSKALGQIDYEPKFLLIFSTIHYAKGKGGLKALLKGCRDLVGKEIPSIGGTVTGFICSEGCFTRGCVVVASRMNCDAYSFFAKNIRRNPNLVGRIISKKTKESTKDSRFINKLLIDYAPAPINPEILSHNVTQKIIKSLPRQVVYHVRDLLFEVSVKFLRYGQGREDEALEVLSKELRDFYLFGASTFDDTKDLSNYQFYQDQLSLDSMAALAISTDMEIKLKRFDPLTIPSGKRFKIKRGWQNRCFDEINGKPAVKTFFWDIMSWPESWNLPSVGEVFHKTFYYPLGYEKDGITYAFPAGLFFGESINTNQRIDSDEIEVLYTSANKIISSLDSYLNELSEEKKETHLLFIVDAAEVPCFLASKIYLFKNQVDKYFHDTPYLTIFGAGEHYKIPQEKLVFNNFSRVVLSIH